MVTFCSRLAEGQQNEARPRSGQDGGVGDRRGLAHTDPVLMLGAQSTIMTGVSLVFDCGPLSEEWFRQRQSSHL